MKIPGLFQRDAFSFTSPLFSFLECKNIQRHLPKKLPVCIIIRNVASLITYYEFGLQVENKIAHDMNFIVLTIYEKLRLE